MYVLLLQVQLPRKALAGTQPNTHTVFLLIVDSTSLKTSMLMSERTDGGNKCVGGEEGKRLKR